MINQRIVLEYFGLPSLYEVEKDFTSLYSYMEFIYDKMSEEQNLSDDEKEKFGARLHNLENHINYNDLKETNSTYALLEIDRKYDLKNFDFLSTKDVEKLKISDKDRVSVSKVIAKNSKGEEDDSNNHIYELIGALILYPFISLVFVTLFLPYYRIEIFNELNLGVGLSPYDLLIGAHKYGSILPDELLKFILFPLLIWMSLISLLGGIVSKQGEHIIAGIIIYGLAGGLLSKFTDFDLLGIGGKINIIVFALLCLLIVVAIILGGIVEWLDSTKKEKHSLYKRFEEILR